MKQTGALDHAAVRASAEAFAPFGRVARLPEAAPLAATPQLDYWSDAAAWRIEGETEIGYCTVRRPPGDRVDWMERHLRTPEILIPGDAPLLLPVMAEDGAVRVFRVEPGEAVVLRAGVWHSACRPAGGGAATYFVIFRRGTPQEDVEKRAIAPVTL